jgi:hypothetical protein
MYRKLIGACVGLAIAGLVIGAPRPASATLIDASYSISFFGDATGTGTFDVVATMITNFTATINGPTWLPLVPLVNDTLGPGMVAGLITVTPTEIIALVGNGTWTYVGGLPCGSCDPSIPLLATGTYTVMAAAPEPSTLALFATGLALLAFIGWRRRKAA